MDKLPLQNILRQLLCGAVFFFSIFVLLPDKEMGFVRCAKVSDMENLWLGCAFVMSLAVGTLIYHFEKNLYSYSVQIILMRTCPDPPTSDNETSSYLHPVGCTGLIGGIVALVLLLIFVLFFYHCNNCHQRITPVMFALIGLLFIVLVLVTLATDTNIRDVADVTRRLWCVEAGVKSGKNDASSTNTEKDAFIGKAVIMRRVGNWADFIHCGQSCAFAWILGSFCVFIYCTLNSVTCPYFVINIGLLASLSALFFELFADWHRYHHVLYVLNNKSDGESQPNPTSNSHQ